MPRLPMLLALCALALPLAGCGERDEPEIAAPDAQSQFEIRGQWRGQLTQQGEKPFSVQAEIVSLERFKANEVTYGGIDCSGTWEYLGASESAYRFQEKIERGAGGACRGEGTVSLTPLSDDQVGYEFRGGAVVSRGELRRVLPAKAG